MIIVARDPYALLKAHVAAYVRSDGVVVNAHETRAPAAKPAPLPFTRVEMSEEDMVLSNWEWPNSSGQTEMDYEEMRDPSTKAGKRLTAVLDRLPLYHGVLWRGMRLQPKDVQRLVAKGYTLPLNSSSSRSRDIAKIFMSNEIADGEPVMLRIEGGGADINNFLDPELRGTEEVVLRAGTRYRFKGLTRLADHIQVDLEQVP